MVGDTCLGVRRFTLPRRSAGTMQEEAAVEPAASFSSLPAGLAQDILRHLDLKGQGRAACVSKLCASAVLPLAPALAHYVTAGDAPAVRRLLQKPGARLGLDNPSCERGRTPLQTAVAQNNLEIFAALLEAGAATEARGINGWTALILAATWGRASMVAPLLAAGAALEARTRAEAASSLFCRGWPCLNRKGAHCSGRSARG